jgi:aryl-alcohol dehydrogenase-like predicted oxidoreductase
LASGFLTGKYNFNQTDNSRLEREELDWLSQRLRTEENFNRVNELNKLAQDLGTTLPKMAIAWCLKNPDVSTVILGASKEQQLIENLTAHEVVHLLTAEVMETIDGILKNTPIRPQF